MRVVGCGFSGSMPGMGGTAAPSGVLRADQSRGNVVSGARWVAYLMQGGGLSWVMQYSLDHFVLDLFVFLLQRVSIIIILITCIYITFR